MLSSLNENQLALAEAMGSLSEAAHHAGWMEGLEFDLWRAVVDGPRRYGRLDVTADHVAHLRGLSQACGGWIVFDRDKEETFVPIDRWLDIYRERMTEPPACKAARSGA